MTVVVQCTVILYYTVLCNLQLYAEHGSYVGTIGPVFPLQSNVHGTLTRSLEHGAHTAPLSHNPEHTVHKR